MNERIKQLAAEVGISVEYLNNTKQWALIEALAERIVGECMDNLAWHGHDEAVNQLEWFRVNKLGMK
jgi:dihydroneopterin aldolase